MAPPNKKRRNAQASIVIIIGITLLIITTLTMYIAKSSAERKISQSTSQSFSSLLDARPIADFVGSCLRSTAKDGLELLGKQGGFIYQSQGGVFPDFQEDHEGIFFLPFQGYRVAYGISPSAVFLPDYPSTSKPYGPRSPPQDQTGSGISSLPQLNGSSSSQAYQLARYVENSIDKCTDFKTFEENGLTIERGEKKAAVSFTASATIVEMKYPLLITNNATGEQAAFEEFSTQENVRLSLLNPLIISLIMQDTDNIIFNLSLPQDLPDGVSFSILPDIINQDDLLILKDSQSAISGKPFEFWTGRHNRNPAIVFLERDPSFSYQEPDGLNFSRGTNITPELLQEYFGIISADDPDEDGTNYTYVIISSSSHPELPQQLMAQDTTIRITASDGLLEDYQDIHITANINS